MARPEGRNKQVSGGGSGVSRRGSGTGMGHVGRGSALGSGSSGGFSGGGPSGRSGFGMGRPGGGYRGPSRGGGMLGAVVVLLLLIVLGGGRFVSGFLGGGDASYQDAGAYTQSTEGFGQNGGAYQTSQSSSGSSGLMPAHEVDRNVAPQARAKYTQIKGDGTDQVTLMVYLCGTDLESKHGMASNDLNEMAAAASSDQVNIIVYTGGCASWKTRGISSLTNQIWKVENGGLNLLEKDMGNGAMTDPKTLTSFLNYCKSNYPANRNMLIFWDHGGGSVSGYGYDEKNAGKGSMTLDGIDSALSASGLKFDLIGFDACLMATVETDLMAAKYADYRISSEETEPGVGWYYTNWVNSLVKNPGLSTLDLGKQIVDDFVETCARTCPGQKTTLSLVDLSELQETLPDEFKAFAESTSRLIREEDYKQVADARVEAREFARSSKIDQIDLIHFAENLGTPEAGAMARVLKSAVKYNRIGAGMSNSNGISVYFPYRKTSNVTKAVGTYDRIGLDSAYSDCIREFASLEVSGQAAYGGSTPFASLLGQSAPQEIPDLSQLTSLFGSLSSGTSSMMDVMGLFSGRSLSDEETARYVEAHRFAPEKLVWQVNAQGIPYLSLDEEQWELVHSVDQNLYYDDGTGFVDLGLDNLYSYDEEGNLLADTDNTWLSVNGQVVAYYHLDTVEEGNDTILTGYIPALLNGERVELMVRMNNADSNGVILGANPVYNGETETLSRGLIEIKDGDTLDFLCDYYDYNGNFDDSYYLGEQMTVNGPLTLSNTDVGGKTMVIYRFTDIYNQSYYTPVMP